MRDPFVLAAAVRDESGRCVDLTCAYANAAAGHAGLIGRPVLGVLPATSPGLLEACIHVWETGEPLDVLDLRSPPGADSRERTYDLHAWQVDDSVAVAWRDVPDPADPALAVRQSVERFRLEMAVAPIGMGLLAASGRFVEVNQALCDYFGLDRTALVARTWQELTHPEDLAASVDLIRQLRDGQRDSYRLTKRHVHADGSVLHADISVSAIRNADGSVRYITGQLIDTTQLTRALVELEAERLLRVSESRYRSVLAALGVGVVVQASDGRIVEANETAQGILGVSMNELADWTSVLNLERRVVHGDGSPFPRRTFPGVVALRTGAPVRDVVMGVYQPDGSLTWIQVNAEPVFDSAEAASPGSVISSIRDVTVQVQAMQALSESEARFRASLDALYDPVFFFSAVRDDRGRVEDLRYTYVNAAAARLYGRRAEGIVGHGLLEMFPSAAEIGAFDCYAAPLSTGAPSAMRVPNFDENGVSGAFDVSAAAFSEEEVVVIAREITADLTAMTALKERAERDDLTGLLSRAAILDQLEAILGDGRRARRACAALFCDLDDFKTVNDTRGHAAGDALLRAVAVRTVAAVRTGDLVGRLGGDEILVVLHGVDAADDAMRVAEKISRRVAALHVSADAGRPVSATVSIGVAEAGSGETADDLISRADRAMYRAKQAGRGQVSYMPAEEPARHP